MGKITRKKLNTCDLCCEIINNSSHAPSPNHKQSASLLWNYLYHQNVREALLPLTVGGNEDESGIPKLTFSLTFGTAVSLNEANVPIKICEECTLELDKLDKLHEQLESVKKVINGQINKINDKRLNNEAGQLNKRISEKKGSSLAHIQPPAGINFAGCSIGKENISQTLTFLSTICDGMPSPTLPIQTSIPSKAQIKTESQDDRLNLMEEPETNGHVNLSYEDTDTIENALDIEIGDEFVSIVKMEDDFGEEEDSKVPEKDPLEISVDAKAKRKYEKRPDYPAGKGPKILPCSLCKKTVFRWNWEIHQKRHAGEKQFKCEQCPERFTTKRSMQRHKRWHQKEFGEHECDKCGKRFLQNYARVRHQKTCQGKVT